MGIRIRKSAVHHSNDSAKHAQTTLSSLRQDTDLWYRICVLVRDLDTFWFDPVAERCLSKTTHELHISAPYFSESDALKVLTTQIQNTGGVVTTEKQWASGSQETPLPSSEITTLEDAIHDRWAIFGERRRASGISRPCQPYHMVPIFMSVLGINEDELKDERFLRRLTRYGPGKRKSQ